MANERIEYTIDGDATGAKRAFDSVISSMTGTFNASGLLTRSLGFLAAAFSAVEITKFIGRQIDAADEMGKMSQRTGVASDTLSELTHAFAMADLGAQDLETAFKFLNKSADEAKQGNDATIASYRSLGITLEDLRSKSPDQLMLQIADAVQKIEDPAARTTVLLENFGRAGTKLAPAFKDGAAGIEEFMARARRLGLTVDKEFSESAERFNDNVKLMGEAAAGTGRQFAKALLPVLNETLEAFFDLFGESSAEAGPWSQGLVTAFGLISMSLIGLGQIVNTVFTVISTAFKVTGTMIAGVVASAEQALSGNLSGAVDTLGQAWTDANSQTSTALEDLNKDLFKAADRINAITSSIDNFGNTAQKTGDQIKEAGKGVIDPVSKEAAARLIALQTKQTEYFNSLASMNAKATNDKIALLDAEKAKQLAVMNDLKLSHEQRVLAENQLDQWYAAERENIHRSMTEKLGITNAAYREQQKILLEEDAIRMQEAGVSELAADSYVKQGLIQQQLNYIAAKNALIDQDTLMAEERATLQLETDNLRNQLALEQGLITQAEYDARRVEAETQKQATLGDISARADMMRLQVSRMTLDQQLAHTSGVLGQMSQLMNTQNEKQFKIGKAAAIAQAVINTYQAATAAYASASAIPFVGWILGPVAAAAAIALGMANVSKIKSQQMSGQAHAGMTDVPSEGTFLLDKGERVLSPEQNKDLTGFLEGQEGGGASVQSVTVNITVPNGEALLGMTRRDWEEIVADKVLPAFNDLDRKGVRPNFVQRYAR